MVSFDICEGNPGCLTFLMDAYNKFLFRAECAFQRMSDAGIKGAQLYMLWNDCLDRDTARAVEIMFNDPIEDIKEHINYKGGRGIHYSEKEKTDD